MTESKTLRGIKVYLKSDAGSTEKYGGYKQYESSLIFI
jgi:hypothetical protein